MAKGIQRDNLYNEITDKIIADLEQGVRTWMRLLRDNLDEKE